VSAERRPVLRLQLAVATDWTESDKYCGADL